MKNSTDDLQYKIDYLAKRNIDIQVFFETLEEMLDEANEIYH